MSQHYTDPKRASDAWSLPDLEVWQDSAAEVDCMRGCGLFTVPYATVQGGEVECPSCGRQSARRTATRARSAWWYWFCLPGCMPDSEPFGPFATEAEALDDARETAGVY